MPARQMQIQVQAQMENKLLFAAEGIELPAWLSRAQDFLECVLKKRSHHNWELSVLFCSNEYIRNLNRQFRAVDAPTDVLSFEQGGEYSEYTDENGKVRYAAGDIVISLEFLAQNAADFAVSQNEELKRLLIHGILHLEGMDHGENRIGAAMQCEMLSLQERLLNEFASYSIIEEK